MKPGKKYKVKAIGQMPDDKVLIRLKGGHLWIAEELDAEEGLYELNRAYGVPDAESRELAQMMMKNAALTH